MLVEKQYRLASGEPLGTGGWCVVHRAEDLAAKRSVAVKTFSDQAVRSIKDDVLKARFVNEMETFERLGVGPPPLLGQPLPPITVVVEPAAGPGGKEIEPRSCLVNLLDYSRDSASGRPGRAADGKYYSILELASESLPAWLEKRGPVMELRDFLEIALSLAEGLTWLHANGLCHLDVKPDNLMRFPTGGWKLIDLEGCQAVGGGPVSTDCFTPMYASPELARSALASEEGTEGDPGLPSGKMDTWGAGAVLLDVLCQGPAFEETKAGFQAASLFDEDCSPNSEWYRWLCDMSSPVLVKDYVPATGPGAALLQAHPDVADMVQGLLHKDPSKRPSAREFLEHPCFARLHEQKAPRTSHAATAPKVEVKADAGSADAVELPSPVIKKLSAPSSPSLCRCCKRRRTQG
mmetsp:Transcript_46636/g.110897  ORF Transcript_46636/g.110897 Transcript_46636/m.110897 type:complete len:406 (-) Transcript_46636:31-1248(-)